MKKEDFLSLIQNLVFDLDSQIHIIKHFSKLDDNYIAYLQNDNNVSFELIKEKLSLKGSIFNYSFASNPLQLIDKLITADVIELIEESFSNNIELRLKFSMTKYPMGVGSNNLVNLNTLNKKQISIIENKVFNGENIQFVRTKAQITNEIIFVTLKNKTKFNIITIYPGIYAPPFPLKDKQSAMFYNHCRNFWDEHVFLYEP